MTAHPMPNTTSTARRVASLIMLILCALLPCCAAPAKTSPAESAHISAMTFNIRYGTAKDGPNHWDKRRELVFDVVRHHGGDFIGMQEAMKFQIDQIAAAVAGWSYYGRSRQIQAEPGEWCPIFYRAQRWRIHPEECGTFWLSETPQTPGSKSWDSSLPRIATWARFTDKASGFSLYVFNTHFDHRGQQARQHSAELLAQRVAARRHPELPVIVMGDLNAGETNSVVRTLNASFEHTFRAVHPDAHQTGTTTGWNGRTDGAMIDHIYTTRGAQIVSAQIIHDHLNGRYPSDHYPVTATMNFPALK